MLPRSSRGSAPPRGATRKADSSRKIRVVDTRRARTEEAVKVKHDSGDNGEIEGNNGSGDSDKYKNDYSDEDREGRTYHGDDKLYHQSEFQNSHAPQESPKLRQQTSLADFSQDFDFSLGLGGFSDNHYGDGSSNGFSPSFYTPPNESAASLQPLQPPNFPNPYGDPLPAVTPVDVKDRPTEPGPTVAGRPRNLHIPITISDDRSKDSDIKARFLLALRTRNQSSGPASRPSVPLQPPPTVQPGNHALQDYQSQLMLLEQQNKRRLQIARQEQDSVMPSQGLSPYGYPQTDQLGRGGTVPIQNLPGTMTQPSVPQYPRNLGFQLPSQIPEQQSFNMSTREHKGGHMGSAVPRPPMPIDRKLFSTTPDQTASVEPTSRPPEMAIDGTHTVNSIPSSSVPGTSYNGDAVPPNFVGRSMSPANPTYTHSQTSHTQDESSYDLTKLLAHIQSLQRKADVLSLAKRELEPPQYMILHRLSRDNNSTVYLDAPQWAVGQDNSRVLTSSLPLSNVSAYIEKHPTVAFVVYRKYNAKKLLSASAESEGEDNGDESGISLPPTHTEESISIVSSDLILALTEFLKTAPEFTEVADSISRYEEVPAPYLFIYHFRSVIPQYLDVISEQRRKKLNCLLEYIYLVYRDEYNEVDSLLQRNKIRLDYIKYLFRPGEVVVEQKDRDIRGYCTKSQLSPPTIRKTPNRENNATAKYAEALRCLIGADEDQTSANANSKIYTWKVSGWSWKFDGKFLRAHATLELSIEVHDKQEQREVDINNLNLLPLAFADEGVKQRLKKRGEMFWKCRFQHLVSYHDPDNHDLDRAADERFMIDLKTYRELHKSQDEVKIVQFEMHNDELGQDLMKQSDPPDGKFVYVLPLTIKGFNLQRKRWVDLQVDRMDEVVWNKKAFKSLVLAHKTKDLIQALISKQLDSERSTDLIHGKGNGLILLLHGGPGTGKTLTAESVAEIAEKPLYRVTCGDIGTEPEDVEAYLESVLHLGKIWKGVVLLDEADVFLEQRSLDDLRRNALVSIFLRVLEYYDGILVLTSNRVGTFDEAFKSRIQLALHYPKLDHTKRAKVWENFIERLEDLKEENIDFNDLRDNVETLAKNKMNGREIRNAITLARQYTQWKKTKLNYVELQDIIQISGQFDVYLSELNSHIPQDQLAQDDGLRLAEADK